MSQKHSKINLLRDKSCDSCTACIAPTELPLETLEQLKIAVYLCVAAELSSPNCKLPCRYVSITMKNATPEQLLGGSIESLGIRVGSFHGSPIAPKVSSLLSAWPHTFAAAA